MDFRRTRSRAHTPFHIRGTEVERDFNFKFLGVHITKNLSWSLNSSSLVKKAHQRLHRILSDFYCCTTESILTNCISVWYGNCNAADRKALQRVVNSAQRTIGCPLPPIHNTYHDHCLNKAKSIVKDDTHPNRTSRHKYSFFPEAVTLLNKPQPPV